MINLGNPDMAFSFSFLPCDGVGLARMVRVLLWLLLLLCGQRFFRQEFIINEYVKVHPMALLYPERVPDARERAEIVNIIRNSPSGEDYMVQQLSEGIGTITAAFYPRPVVVRLSDFKTNESDITCVGIARSNSSDLRIGMPHSSEVHRSNRRRRTRCLDSEELLATLTQPMKKGSRWNAEHCVVFAWIWV
jgi:phosphoenolpyruvate synthase/pyruvate phosphate dikinase